MVNEYAIKALDHMVRSFARSRGLVATITKPNEGSYASTLSFYKNDQLLYTMEVDPWEYSNAYELFVEIVKCVEKRLYTNECIGKLMSPIEKYCEFDVKMTKAAAYHSAQRNLYKKLLNNTFGAPVEIKKVIFNDPATIVFWSDNTKTVVKAQDLDDFDPEKGMAMAIAKKFLGTNESGSNYYEEIKKWVEPYYEKAEVGRTIIGALKEAIAMANNLPITKKMGLE